MLVSDGSDVGKGGEKVSRGPNVEHGPEQDGYTCDDTVVNAEENKTLLDLGCTELIETEGFRNIRAMFEEVRSSGIAHIGMRRLGLTLWKLIKWCRRAHHLELKGTHLTEQEIKEDVEWKALLVQAENDMLKCTEGNEEKLKGLMEPDEPETIEFMAKPTFIASEDDDVRGAADLGKLIGRLDHGMGGAFVAKFTRVVEWPSVSFRPFRCSARHAAGGHPWRGAALAREGSLKIKEKSSYETKRAKHQWRTARNCPSKGSSWEGRR